MASAKSVALVCLAILAVSSAALSVAAADAPSTRPAAGAASDKLGVLPKPLGSGLNTPKALGRKPKYGRRFLNLMQKLIGAARSGDLKLAQQIQQQLFYVTKLRGHRRHLLQVGFAGKLLQAGQHAPGAGFLAVPPEGQQRQQSTLQEPYLSILHSDPVPRVPLCVSHPRACARPWPTQ
jgi:hypothetical protein